MAFSHDGRALFALVQGALLSRDVATGRTTLTPLPEGLFSFPEAGPGDSVFLRELSSDTDRDGRLVWEHARTTRHLGVCTGPALSFSIWSSEGDLPTGAVVSPASALVTRVAVRLHPFRSGYVDERPGELTFHAPDGTERALTPPNAPGCRPTPLHVDPTRELMLFHCGQGEHGMLYAWTARSGVRALSDFRGVVARESVERYPRLLRVFPLRAQGDRLRSRAVLDLDTLEVKDVRGVPTYSAGPRVVTRTLVPERAPTHWEVAWFDSETGSRRILNAPDWIPRGAAGDFIVLGHSVYDMRTGQRRGGFDDGHDEWGQGCRLVGLDGTGRVLIRENPEDRGPLLWVQPGWF